MGEAACRYCCCCLLVVVVIVVVVDSSSVSGLQLVRLRGLSRQEGGEAMAVHAPGRRLASPTPISARSDPCNLPPNVSQVDIREGMEVHRDWFNAAGSKREVTGESTPCRWPHAHFRGVRPRLITSGFLPKPKMTWTSFPGFPFPSRCNWTLSALTCVRGVDPRAVVSLNSE